MNVRKRVLFVAALCCLGLGILTGRLVWGGKDVEAAGSVVFVVYPDGEMYLRPRPKETIEWVRPNPDDITGQHNVPLAVHFDHGSPCKKDAAGHDNDISRCTIKDKPLGTYLYTCENKLCKDPGIDPNSSDGTLRRPPKPPGPPRSALDGQRATTSTRDVADVAFDVYCENGQVVSHQTAGNNTVTTGIFWKPTDLKLSFKVDDPHLCTLQAEPHPYGNGYLCTVQGAASGKTYNVTATDSTGSCSKTSVTNAIQH